MRISDVSWSVESTASVFADRVAVLDGDCLHDYATLWEAVGLFAAELDAAGVRAGQRVAVYIGSGYESLLTLLAVEHLGAVAVPLDIFGPVEHAVRTLHATGADHLIGHVGDGDLVEELAEDPVATGASVVTVADDYTLIRLWRSQRVAPSHREGGFAFCLPGSAGAMTVGSTTLAAAAGELCADLPITAEDVVAVTAPLTERAAITAVLAAVRAGACLSLRRYSGVDPVLVAEQLGEDDATVLACSSEALCALRAAGLGVPSAVRVLALSPEAPTPAVPVAEAPLCRPRGGSDAARSRPARSGRRASACATRDSD
ncbi:AMP-binding protein [Nocardia lasii]|uniref:AMP-binding protein n=1 Tax=Nocardia lasii TaxID=1616107 RepID=A0ABW1JPC9_9NOCA